MKRLIKSLQRGGDPSARPHTDRGPHSPEAAAAWPTAPTRRSQGPSRACHRPRGPVRMCAHTCTSTRTLPAPRPHRSGPLSCVCSRNESWAWRAQKPSPEKRSQSLPRRDSGMPMATSFRIFSVRNMHTVLPYSEKWSFQRLTLICSLDWKRKHARRTKRHCPQPITEGAPSAERAPTCARQFAGQAPLNVHPHAGCKGH